VKWQKGCCPGNGIVRKIAHVVIARKPEADKAISKIMDKQYYIYIMSNKHHTALYTGVTNELKRRVYEHKQKMADGFTRKYNITKLVYYEVYEDPINAISREKQIKGGSRQKKIELINSTNRHWADLYEGL